METNTQTMNGAAVIARTKDAVYLRIPLGLQRPIEGGCSCDQCRANPALAKWDTLLVPVSATRSDYASTVHMPDASVPGFIEYTRRKESR